MRTKSKRLAVFFLFLCLLIPHPFLTQPALADWAFAVLGDSRDDFRRDRVFPGMLQEIRDTSYRIKGQEIKPEFILHLGDFELLWGSRESLERFRERMKAGIPYLPVKGNHELVPPLSAHPSLQQVLEDNQPFIAEYKNLLGLNETYFSRDHRDLHTVVLDNSLGSFQTKPGEGLRSPQLAWLEEDLRETAAKVEAGKIRHTIICAHIPLPSPSAKNPIHDLTEFAGRYAEGKSTAGESAKYFWEILDRNRRSSRIEHLYFAHDHRYLSYRQNGFPVTITGGAGAPLIEEEKGGFYHYVLVFVGDDGLRERIIKAYPKK